MAEVLHPMHAGQVNLLPGLILHRAGLNRAYLVSLQSENLLQNYYLEAGFWSPPGKPEAGHWGWELPTCQLRGHFLGHWLSAAARSYAFRSDYELKAKADRIVSELGRCQAENGGEWAGSIPEKYFDWIAMGKTIWAPHYTVHKTMMGLYEMAVFAQNEQALDILGRWADWFYRWSSRFDRGQMDAILEYETGGMVELWADLYALTLEPKYLELIGRYERRRFFEAVLGGEDVLTNQHANTRIPEIQGAARAWEVSGDQRWRRIAEAFWRSAVLEREAFCTGGQTDGEIWTPPGELAARLSQKNQEHCTVYNMMRLAGYLYRWSGDPAYADYWERNLYNGILAQQHPDTGMVAYFLPLRSGSVKKWSTPTESFWCCVGTLVQAHTTYEEHIFHQDDEGLVVSQFIPSRLDWEWKGTRIEVMLKDVKPLSAPQPPRSFAVELAIQCAQEIEFAVRIRVPGWVRGSPVVRVGGQPVEVSAGPNEWIRLRRFWNPGEALYVEFPKQITARPLPDAPEMAAFMDGPVVLAGVSTEAFTLPGSVERPEAILAPVHELEWYQWRQGYRTRVAPHGTRFLPLYDIRDERYTVYFAITDHP